MTELKTHPEGGRSVWYDASHQAIHVASHDPRFHDGNGGKLGTHDVYSCDPRSADYSPKNFNRWARWLRDEEAPAPAQDAPEYPVHLCYRVWVIAEVYSLEIADVTAEMATPPVSMLPSSPQLTLVSQP
jgi:hypothetical protein